MKRPAKPPYRLPDNVYYCSDHHFYHRNIINYCKRPFASAEEMNMEMIRRWNEVIPAGTDKEVWHLGDFGLCKLDELSRIREQLNGRIHLVLGNHDRLRPAQYLAAGFESVHQSWQMKLGNHQVRLQHRPPTEHEPWPRGVDLTLSGHIHDRPGWWEARPGPQRIFNCSVERIGYRPVTLGQLMEIYRLPVRQVA